MSARPPWRSTLAKRRWPPSQGWRTDAIASIDMFVVPTISFGLLYGLLILRPFTPRASVAGCDSRSPCGMACPSADRGCGWDEPPRYLIRDRDGAYGAAFIRRIRAIGIRDRPVSARSARSDGNVLITSSSLASAIFATFSHRTKERTFRCRRTRRFGVTYAKQGACVRRRSWAGYTINMFEFEFPTGTGALPHPDLEPRGRNARAATDCAPCRSASLTVRRHRAPGLDAGPSVPGCSRAALSSPGSVPTRSRHIACR
jgi:hypothetical protein